MPFDLLEMLAKVALAIVGMVIGIASLVALIGLFIDRKR